MLLCAVSLEVLKRGEAATRPDMLQAGEVAPLVVLWCPHRNHLGGTTEGGGVLAGLGL
jgi:hypothetical protein